MKQVPGSRIPPLRAAVVADDLYKPCAYLRDQGTRIAVARQQARTGEGNRARALETDAGALEDRGLTGVLRQHAAAFDRIPQVGVSLGKSYQAASLGKWLRESQNEPEAGRRVRGERQPRTARTARKRERCREGMRA